VKKQSEVIRMRHNIKGVILVIKNVIESLLPKFNKKLKKVT